MAEARIDSVSSLKKNRKHSISNLAKLIAGCFPYQTNSSTSSKVVAPPLPQGLPPASTVVLPVVDSELEPLVTDSPPIAALPDDLLLECLGRVDRTSIGPMMGVCKKWRVLTKSVAFPETRSWLGLLEECLFVVSKAAESDPVLVQLYCPSQRSWSHSYLYEKDVAESSLSIDDASKCCRLQQELVILGGIVSTYRSAPPVIYSPWTNSLREAAQLSFPRTNFVCSSDKEMLYVVGGLRDKKLSGSTPRDLTSAEVYRPDLDTWFALPGMKQPRVGAVGGIVNGKFYILAGTHSVYHSSLKAWQQAPLKDLEVYDPATRTWESKGAVPRTGFIISSAVLGSAIYIMRNETSRISWLRYETTTDEWAALHDLPLPHNFKTVHQVDFTCVTVGRRIFVVQVWGASQDLFRREAGSFRGAVVLAYDPSRAGAAAWKRVPNMPFVTKGAVCEAIAC
eukprot:jgi/Mesen1/518/ME000104S10604